MWWKNVAKYWDTIHNSVKNVAILCETYFCRIFVFKKCQIWNEITNLKQNYKCDIWNDFLNVKFEMWLFSSLCEVQKLKEIRFFFKRFHLHFLCQVLNLAFMNWIFILIINSNYKCGSLFWIVQFVNSSNLFLHSDRQIFIENAKLFKKIKKEHYSKNKNNDNRQIIVHQ